MVDGTPVADPTRSPASSSSSQFPPSGPLRPGNCVAVTGFTVVDCAQPHELEVYRFDPLPPDFPASYPTAATLLPRFEPRCRAELLDYLSSPDADASRLREFVYWPSRQGWNAGERWVLCAVVEIGPDDRPLQRTGALRGILRAGLGPFQACATDPPSQGPLRVVRCEEPHQGEAVPGVLVLGAPTDPPVTAEQANAAAEPHCRRVIDD
ncbi:MAG TPA: septum formation family protein, partial [Pseudonocardiaceae bacterium]|nr:septum formation family protein [Pseudonocardiaceae bacterium]